jgi:hypothetical protein
MGWKEGATRSSNTPHIPSHPFTNAVLPNAKSVVYCSCLWCQDKACASLITRRSCQKTTSDLEALLNDFQSVICSPLHEGPT